MSMKKGIRALVDEASAEIETLTPAQAAKLLGDENTVIVDIRDPRELERDGRIPGSFHATRGMLEFWIDPESPYHKPIFASGKKFVFYCAGGLRSALATKTAQDMGLTPVAHIEGGYGASMLMLLKNAPNVSELSLCFIMSATEVVDGMCKGLHLVNPTRIILRDIPFPKDNKPIRKLMDTLVELAPKWDKLVCDPLCSRRPLTSPQGRARQPLEQ